MPKRLEVDAWFAKSGNPLCDVMMFIRDSILAADPRMDECIKWQTPTFTYEGNLASFNPRSKQHVSLLFHTGAQIPGRHPRLEGAGDTARVMKIKDLADAKAARAELRAIVAAWIASRGEPKKKTAAKKPATRKTAAKTVAKKTARR